MSRTATWVTLLRRVEPAEWIRRLERETDLRLRAEMAAVVMYSFMMGGDRDMPRGTADERRWFKSAMQPLYDDQNDGFDGWCAPGLVAAGLERIGWPRDRAIARGAQGSYEYMRQKAHEADMSQIDEQVERIEADDDRMIEILRGLIAEDFEAAASVLYMLRGVGDGELLIALVKVRVESAAALEVGS